MEESSYKETGRVNYPALTDGVSGEKDENGWRKVRPFEDPPERSLYKSSEQHLGKVASSYGEFASQIKSVETSSLVFHLMRHDFANWFRMLGTALCKGSLQAWKRRGYKASS